jgi:molecular chaperone GrpE
MAARRPPVPRSDDSIDTPEAGAAAPPVDGAPPPVDADEVERLRQANLRLLADFENLRRRQAREGEAAERKGRRAVLLALLPVLDALERALATGSTDPKFYAGVAATQRLFERALREAGVEPIESLHQPFDPSLHEALATVETDEAEPGTVVREEQRGWRMGDELLRPARVVVASSREKAAPWR